jgi:hypothetical protein
MSGPLLARGLTFVLPTYSLACPHPNRSGVVACVRSTGQEGLLCGGGECVRYANRAPAQGVLLRAGTLPFPALTHHNARRETAAIATTLTPTLCRCLPPPK